MKKLKRWIAGYLIITLLLPFLSLEVYANPQDPVKEIRVDDVHYKGGQNPITGSFQMEPTIKVTWENPDKWADGNGSSEPNNIQHQPYGYTLILKNRTKGGNLQQKDIYGEDKINAKTNGSNTIDIHQYLPLETGTFYEIQAKPYHYHEKQIGDNTVREKIMSREPNPSAFALTDIHLVLHPSQDQITVEWEDVGYGDTKLNNLEYKITYAVGDFTNRSKDELIKAKAGEVTVKKGQEGVEAFYDNNARRNKLKYTFKERILPGQLYSFIIEPMIDQIEDKKVQRNRQFPPIFTTMTQLNLTVREDGDYVRLEWNIPPEMTLGQEEKYRLKETFLVEYQGGIEKNIAIFPNTEGASINHYRYRKPEELTEYQIKLVYGKIGDETKIIKAESSKVPFVPTSLLLRPIKPYIPNPIPKDWDKLEDIKEKESYLLPEDHHQTDQSRKDLIVANRVLYVNPESYVINLIWSAFRRKEYDLKSQTYGERITDFDTYYDIWVADDYQILSQAAPIYKDFMIMANDTEKQIINRPGNTVGYHIPLNTYYQQSSRTLQPIIPNQVYYIKVIAKKKWGDQELRSEPEIKAIYIDYNGDAFVPPVLSKPPLKEKETRQRQSTITWRENWFEIISKNIKNTENEEENSKDLKEWNARVWLKNGQLYNEAQEGAIEFELNTQSDVDRLKKQFNSQATEGKKLEDVYTIREVRMGTDHQGKSDIQYEFLSIPYAQVEEELQRQQAIQGEYDLEEYIKDFAEQEQEEDFPYVWKNISPTMDSENKEQLLYTETGLEPNTTYLFLIRGFRQGLDGEILRAFYPTPVMITTLLEEEPMYPDPTVPYLRLHEAKDIDITVKWRYNTAFTYEIRYSDVEDVEKAQTFPIVLPEDPKDPKYPKDDTDYLLTIPDLFPNTQYYFWIQATQNETGKQSAWSNPLVVTTKDVKKPSPPKGVGLGSKENLKIKGYKDPVAEDYITIEWLRDWEDLKFEQEGQVGTTILKKYSYIVEVSDSPLFTDRYTVETTDENIGSTSNNFEILMKNLVKANGLVGNRMYYARVKTKVTVTGGGDQQIEKESDYSTIIQVFTSRTDSEYDGDIDPSKVPLPEQDYELIYDRRKEKLTYRIRGFEIDQKGDKDNRVDQRFISRMIRQGLYTFPIDMKEYHRTVKERVVEIPYTVVQTFADRKMGIRLYTDGLDIRIPYEVFKQILQEAGSDANMEIQIYNWKDKAKNPSIYGSYTYSPQSNIQELTIIGNGSKGSKSLSYTTSPMEINVPYDKYDNYYENNAVLRSLYIQDKEGIWKEHKGQDQPEKNQYHFQAQTVGTYGIFTPQSTIYTIGYDPSYSAMNTITAKYGIKQIQDGTYNPYSYIRQNQIGQLFRAIVYHTQNSSLVLPLTKTQEQQLRKSQLWAFGKDQGEILNRQEAIALLVGLYEAKSGEPMGKPYSQSYTLEDYGQVQTPYRNRILKAKDLGLIDTQVRPNDMILWKELFPMLYDILVMTGDL